MMNAFMFLSCFFFLILSLSAEEKEVLSLERYLHQVEELNPQIQGTDVSIKGMEEKSLEMDMVYSPYVNAGYTFSLDKSGSSFGSSLPLEESKTHQWEASLTKKTSLGTQVSTGYSNMS